MKLFEKGGRGVQIVKEGAHFQNECDACNRKADMQKSYLLQKGGCNHTHCSLPPPLQTGLSWVYFLFCNDNTWNCTPDNMTIHHEITVLIFHSLCKMWYCVNMLFQVGKVHRPNLSNHALGHTPSLTRYSKHPAHPHRSTSQLFYCEIDQTNLISVLHPAMAAEIFGWESEGRYLCIICIGLLPLWGFLILHLWYAGTNLTISQPAG